MKNLNWIRGEELSGKQIFSIQKHFPSRFMEVKKLIKKVGKRNVFFGFSKLSKPVYFGFNL